jgi:hypothetical protein
MPTLSSERGSTLILLIGIVATLAILATSLVVLTGNVSHNTYLERSRVRAFGVTEAALDKGMYTISEDWPAAAGDTVTFDASGFDAEFPASQFPRADGEAHVASVQFFDNSIVGGVTPTWDANGDERMYVVAQGKLSDGQSRIQVLVERQFYDMNMPRGVPLFAQGTLEGNGGGNNPKIKVEVPPTGVSVNIHVVGGVPDPNEVIGGRFCVTDTGIGQLTAASNPPASPLSDVFPPTLVAGLKKLAQDNGRYFTSLAAAEASPVDPVWAPQGGVSGLCVIEPPAGTTIKFTGTVDLNTEADPGVLMVLGSTCAFEWGGNAQYYGVIYCEGPMSTAAGTGDIHGMVICTSSQALRGTPNILYNDNCLAHLLQRFSMNVKMVTNTWRELTPQ